MKTRLYAAYGSNLNREDWTKWCKAHSIEPKSIDPKPIDPESIKPVGTAWLPDLELVFDYYSKTREGGVLNLRPRRGNLVPVVLFEFTPEGKDALDRKEGNGIAYERIETTAITADGLRLEVFTYRVIESRREKSGLVRPTNEYLQVVQDGYAEHEFDPAALNAAATNTPHAVPVDTLFVYGTLMRQQPRFEYLQQHGVSCALLAQCHGILLDCGAYPGMIAGDTSVQGEFIRLDQFEKAIAELDGIEGFQGYSTPGSLFERRLVEVDLLDGHTRLAWTYCLSDKGTHRVIPSGDWREHTGVKDRFFDDLITWHVDGREHDVALRLTARSPFDVEDETRASKMLPLSRALSGGLFSERELAQVTKKWAVST